MGMVGESWGWGVGGGRHETASGSQKGLSFKRIKFIAFSFLGEPAGRSDTPARPCSYL